MLINSEVDNHVGSIPNGEKIKSEKVYFNFKKCIVLILRLGFTLEDSIEKIHCFHRNISAHVHKHKYFKTPITQHRYKS
jgi:hypothetical protein